MPLEDVRVLGLVLPRGFWPGDSEDLAQLGQEELVVSPFGCPGGFPPLNERLKDVGIRYAL